MTETKRYCKHGHDTWECGRTSNHNCRACEKQRDHDKATERKPFPKANGGGVPQERLEFDRFMTFAERRGIKVYSLASGGTIRRWKTEGIPIYSADELAARLGYHPTAIWGSDWA